MLALDPLDKDHVIRINKAEAEYWKKSEGYRMGWSDELLGFDCGGQQWVSETCFPTGTLTKPSMKDLDYMEELLQLIEKEDVPAPAPIEQRWTARSRSPMSPASSPNEDDIFSWVICSSITSCCCVNQCYYCHHPPRVFLYILIILYLSYIWGAYLVKWVRWCRLLEIIRVSYTILVIPDYGEDMFHLHAKF